jgi:hypothetical protein
MHTLYIHAACIREEEQEVMQMSAEEVLNEVTGFFLTLRFSGLHAFEALAAAVLDTVFGRGCPLDARGRVFFES